MKKELTENMMELWRIIYKVLIFSGMFYNNLYNSFSQSKDTLVAKKEKNIRFSPLPIIYYSPETKLGFGALLAANFNTMKVSDSVTKGSYAQTSFIYTVNKQYNYGVQTRLYFPKNKFIFNAKYNYKYFPEYYFGVETEEPLKHLDSISYNSNVGDFRLYVKISKGFYGGLIARFNKISNVNSRPGGHFIEEMPLGYKGYSALGFAPAFTYETRDNFVNPRRGFYLEAIYFIYPTRNNTFSFQQIKLDIRKYFPVHLFSKSDVLALQLLTNTNTGNVPFKDMADIGGSYNMRGYYTGFYKYKNLYAFQAEYRFNLWKSIGMVVWVGAASTPIQWYTFADNTIKPNGGFGLRYMINKKDRLNLRLDQGFGNQNQNGFYIDVAEAF